VQRIQLMTRVEDENTSAWTRNIVTSTWTIQYNNYEYMDEEHSDEYMDDTNKHECNEIRWSDMSATNTRQSIKCNDTQ
jgi:hypothetical protein